MGKVLVEVEPTLWGRVKSRALERGVKLPEAVGQALRGWLSFDGGSVVGVTAHEAPPAAECGEAVALGPVHVLADVSEALAVPGRRPTRDQLQAQVDGVLVKDAGALLPHQALARATVTDPACVSAREQARERRAAQDRLRTVPEDESQDPGVDF